MRTLTTPARMRTAARQLWGEPDRQHTLAPGVVAYSTPGHGGIVVSTETFNLDARLRDGLFTDPIRWTNSYGDVVLTMVGFEEDCDWAALLYCHPELIEPAVRKGYLGDMVTFEYVKQRVESDDYYRRVGLFS